jgi:signal peptidase I
MEDSLRSQLFKLFLFVLALALIAVGILRWQYVDVVTISHDGMAPTIFGGDKVLVWRTTEYDHGDIILCRHPRRDDAWVVGRIIGRPGMSVSLSREQLVINGQTVSRDFQGTFQFEDQQSHAMAPFRWGVEELGEVDHFFMEREQRTIAMRPVSDLTGFYLLSDNRTYVGEDSRTFGPVPHIRCTGRVFMRWEPGGRAPADFESGWLDFLD